MPQAQRWAGHNPHWGNLSVRVTYRWHRSHPVSCVQVRRTTRPWSGSGSTRVRPSAVHLAAPTTNWFPTNSPIDSPPPPPAEQAALSASRCLLLDIPADLISRCLHVTCTRDQTRSGNKEFLQTFPFSQFTHTIVLHTLHSSHLPGAAINFNFLSTRCLCHLFHLNVEV